jgi:hypothetical protein
MQDLASIKCEALTLAKQEGSRDWGLLDFIGSPDHLRGAHTEAFAIFEHPTERDIAPCSCLYGSSAVR